jgi:hypothetical protein
MLIVLPHLFSSLSLDSEFARFLICVPVPEAIYVVGRVAPVW